MLRKHGIEMQIADIQDRLRLTDEFENRMAVEGSGLEAVYFLATGEIVKVDHAGKDELEIIHKLFAVAQSLTPREHLTVMPFGFARGMKISDYVMRYRQKADGHRYNNTDLLADSLSAAIPDDDDEVEYDDEIIDKDGDEDEYDDEINDNEDDEEF